MKLFALARCLCSISAKDVLGKTVPKGARGGITGTAAAISGVLGFGAALFVLLGVDQSASKMSYGWLILGGRPVTEMLNVWLTVICALAKLTRRNPIREISNDFIFFNLGFA
ncbi:hypothetical protein N9133_03420 [Akkermansiaceae bacterium]|nr:hypothetical protein [Akkermansiaceae bacterium]